MIEISIHALLAESDEPVAWTRTHGGNFYPRSPCGERHATTVIAGVSLNFYPRSPCGERPEQTKLLISIHALLAESDGLPCMISSNIFLFLSTLSLRRATSPNGGQYSVYSISIHALLAESDYTAICCAPPTLNFYPRSPCGERLVGILQQRGHQLISIHALLAESDQPRYRPQRLLFYFYPRSPCGERHFSPRHLHADAHFYPRSPCGERPTTTIACKAAGFKFLSTLSLRRATTFRLEIFAPSRFLSTLSLRRATSRFFSKPRILPISIHALLAESDLDITIYLSNNPISIHALLAESDLLYIRHVLAQIEFLSTLSLRRATCWNSPRATMHT